MSETIQQNTEMLNLIDQVISLDLEIKQIKEERLNTLEEKKGLLIKKLERFMAESGEKKVDSWLGSCTWVIQQRKKIDDEAIFTKFSIPQDVIDANTKITPVQYLKLTPNK